MVKDLWNDVVHTLQGNCIISQALHAYSMRYPTQDVFLLEACVM